MIDVNELNAMDTVSKISLAKCFATLAELKSDRIDSTVSYMAYNPTYARVYIMFDEGFGIISEYGGDVEYFIEDGLSDIIFDSYEDYIDYLNYKKNKIKKIH